MTAFVPHPLHPRAMQRRIGDRAVLWSWCDDGVFWMPADAGVELIVHNTDFGFNDGPFINPARFEEFIGPHLDEIVDHIHRLGMKVIVHTDGNVTALLDRIHASGADGYQSIDPQARMDIREVRARYPDWVPMGNVACNLLQSGDEAAIRAGARTCLEHGGIGRRSIFPTSNSVFAGVPAGGYRVMLDEYRRRCGRGVT